MDAKAPGPGGGGAGRQGPTASNPLFRSALDARAARGRQTGIVRINTRIFNCYRMTLDARKGGRSFQKLFSSERLNYCVVRKEVVPVHLKEVMRPHQMATKLVFPYSEAEVYSRDLQVTGPSIYVGENQYRETLEKHYFENQSIEAMAHDFAVLEVLDDLPSLDPFLIRDKFQSAGLEIDEHYLQIPLAEWSGIRSSIMDRFRPLARIAFIGETVSADDLEQATHVLVEKMWEAIDLDSLLPLTKALRVDPEKAGSLYYAWKGIVHYDFKITGLMRDVAILREALRKLAQTPSARVRDGDVWANWHLPRVRIDKFATDLSDIMTQYHDAYDGFFLRGDDPVAFQRFFAIAEDLFYFPGSAIAVLDSCVEQYRVFRRYEEENPIVLMNFWRDLMELTQSDEDDDDV